MDINKTVIVSRAFIDEMDEILTSFYSQALSDRDINISMIAYKLGLLQGHLERDLLKYNKD